MQNRSSKPPNKRKGPRDFSEIAYEVFQQAIGEKEKEKPEPKPKNPAAVTLGRLGILKGGKKAAKKRWSAD